jgi:hypothetical protein
MGRRFLLPRRPFPDGVLKKVIWGNSIPVSRDEFRIAEFFSTIRPMRSLFGTPSNGCCDPGNPASWAFGDGPLVHSRQQRPGAIGPGLSKQPGPCKPFAVVKPLLRALAASAPSGSQFWAGDLNSWAGRISRPGFRQLRGLVPCLSTEFRRLRRVLHLSRNSRETPGGGYFSLPERASSVLPEKRGNGSSRRRRHVATS